MSLKPIGIFDSGIGGLTVMAAVRKLLPQENLVYLGDTARVPYGNKSAETILRYSEECSTFLTTRDVKAIVIACNTASAHAFPYLTHRFHLPMLGVIGPGVETALAATKTGHIGVIGTQATIASNVYAQELQKKNPDIKVVSVACPLFVPLVEEDWLNNEVTEMVANHYLAPLLKENNIDTLILGCTHYPLLKTVIAKVLGEKIKLVDSAEALALSLKNILEEKHLLNSSKEKPVVQGYVTDLPDRFEKMAHRFLGENLSSVKRASL